MSYEVTRKLMAPQMIVACVHVGGLSIYSHGAVRFEGGQM